jgi:hypothetical protein
MEKKMLRLLLVVGVCVIFVSSCIKKEKASITIGNKSGESPIAETTIDTKKPLSPTPTTGNEAENDPASILIKDYFKALQAGQFERAYSMIDGEFKKKKGSFTEYIQPLTQAAAMGRIYDKVTILSVTSSESGMEKIVTFTISIYENQKQMTLNGVYAVIKLEGKAWKIFDTITQ